MYTGIQPRKLSHTLQYKKHTEQENHGKSSYKAHRQLLFKVAITGSSLLPTLTTAN